MAYPVCWFDKLSVRYQMACVSLAFILGQALLVVLYDYCIVIIIIILAHGFVLSEIVIIIIIIIVIITMYSTIFPWQGQSVGASHAHTHTK